MLILKINKIKKIMIINLSMFCGSVYYEYNPEDLTSSKSGNFKGNDIPTPSEIGNFKGNDIAIPPIFDIEASIVKTLNNANQFDQDAEQDTGLGSDVAASLFDQDAEQDTSQGANQDDELSSKFKKNITFLKAQTGSGKTYSMLRASIQHASDGGIAVVAFPNINLLNENKEKLSNLLNNKYKNWNISLREISLSEQKTNSNVFKSETILNDLCKGKVIYITLHNYIYQRGDFGNYSKFFMVLQAFKSITKIFIDEGHLYIEQFQKNLKINNLVAQELNRYVPISSNKILEEKIIKNEQIFITPQMMLAQKNQFEGQQVGYQLILKKDVVIGTENKFIKPDNFNKIFNSLPQYININTGEGVLTNKFLPLEIEDNDDLNIIKRKISSNYSYPILSDLKIIESNKLQLPYYRIFPISITGDLNKDIKIKSFLIDHYTKIFYFNAYLTIMLSFDANGFIKSLNKYISNSKGDKGMSIEELLGNSKLHEEIYEKLLFFNKKLLETIETYNKAADNVDFKLTLEKIEKDLEYLSQCFAYVFININNNLEPLKPTTEEQALTYSFALSKNGYFVTYNPVKMYTNEPVYDFNQYVCDIKDRESLIKDRESLIKDEETNNIPKEQLDKDIKSLTYSYQKEICFTSELILFSMPELFIFSGFNSVMFLSATYSSAMISQIENVSKNINFIEIQNKQKKLDKLVIIKSNIDWFTSSTPTWKKAWGSLVEYFKDNIWSMVDENNNHKHGLLLAPTNYVAENFFKYAISFKKEFFSLIKGTTESTSTIYMDYKDPEITDTDSFAISPSDASKIFRVSSILSTVSVGLNMPQHIFIIAACNTYKPISTVWKYGDIGLNDARNYETIMALLQAIGRNARKSEQDEKSDNKIVRILLLSKANTFLNTVSTISEYSLNLYKTVEICDITFFENKLYAFFRSEPLRVCYLKGITIFKQKNSSIYNKIVTIPDWESKEDLRFNLLKNILDVYKNPELDIEAILHKYITFCNMYRLYALCIFCCFIGYNFHLEYKKATNKSQLFNKKSKISITFIQKKLNYFRWTEYGIQKENNNVESSDTSNANKSEKPNKLINDIHTEIKKIMLCNNVIETKLEIVERVIRLTKQKSIAAYPTSVINSINCTGREICKNFRKNKDLDLESVKKFSKFLTDQCSELQECYKKIALEYPDVEISVSSINYILEQIEEIIKKNNDIGDIIKKINQNSTEPTQDKQDSNTIKPSQEDSDIATQEDSDIATQEDSDIEEAQDIGLNLTKIVNKFVETYNDFVTQEDKYLKEFGSDDAEEVFIKYFEMCFLYIFENKI